MSRILQYFPIFNKCRRCVQYQKCAWFSFFSDSNHNNDIQEDTHLSGYNIWSFFSKCGKLVAYIPVTAGFSMTSTFSGSDGNLLIWKVSPSCK